jgi:hypothetical protein
VLDSSFYGGLFTWGFNLQGSSIDFHFISFHFIYFHFRIQKILVALLDQFTPLQTYTHREANSLTWFDNVLCAIQKRNRAYSRQKVLGTPIGNVFALYKTWRFFKRFLDSSGDLKRLWHSICAFGLMNTGSDNVVYTFFADELNAYFTTPAKSTGLPDKSHISYCPLIQGDSFLLFYVDEMCLAASIGKCTSNATGLDDNLLAFCKIFLPLILTVVTQLFTFILT